MRNTLAALIRVHKRQGIHTYLYGKYRRVFYHKLRKKYHFGEWHEEPYELRPYAWDIKNYVNTLVSTSYKPMCVCEIGCGLGDIIRNTRADKKIGIDISKETIECAKFLGGGDSEFFVGSFDSFNDIVQKRKIDVLISVNFIHNIEPEKLKMYYDQIMKNITVENIILDVIDSSGYKYCHDIDFLFPGRRGETVISSYKVSSGGERKVYVIDL